MSPGPRWIIRSIAFAVIAGFVTTVAVAWGLAAWVPHRSFVVKFDLHGGVKDGRPNYLAVRQFARAGMCRRIWYPEFTGAGPSDNVPRLAGAMQRLNPSAPRDGRPIDLSWGAFPRAAGMLEGSGPTLGADDARGWPCMALWCEVDPRVVGEGAEGAPAAGGFALTPIATLTLPTEFRALPFRPIWRGLLTNAAVYSAGWWVLVSGTALTRRVVRKRAGRCPECGYDLRGASSGVCPECGEQSPTTARAARVPSTAELR